MTSDDRLLLRSVLSFAALPGIVAYLVPLVLLRPPDSPRPSGLAIACAGTLVLLICVHSFHVRGRGTLAPWDPPQKLVRDGLYRYSRNPMYVGVLTVLFGWALAWPRPALWIYFGAICITFHLRVVLGEEPWLSETHGEAWERYKRDVPRWIGPVVRRPEGRSR